MSTSTTSQTIVFVSYSWSSPEHQAFVIELATKLRGDGVDVRLDKWHLREGQDKFAFMESMVVNPDVTRVLVICDKTYAEKANARTGGVGAETQIISPEIYAKATREKFIPIICERDAEGNECVPIFLKARIYIDLGPNASFADEYEKLLRNIYEAPIHIVPEIGEKPTFLTIGKLSHIAASHKLD